MAITVETFRVQGLSPLLMHNPIGMARPSEAFGKKRIPTPEVEAEAGLYRNDDGSLYFPTVGFRAAGLRGCLGKRIGKMSAASNFAAGVMEIEDRTNLIDPRSGEPITKWEIDIRRVVVQKNGVLRARPIIRHWAADVVFEIDDDFITAAHVREILNVGGRMAGIGDNRPQRKGSNGRFALQAANVVAVSPREERKRKVA